MKGLIWLWKHRSRLNMYTSMSRGIGGKVCPPRPWPKRDMPRPRMSGKVYPTGPIPRCKNRPSPLPGSKGRIEKAAVYPTTDRPNPYLERLDPKKEKQWPAPPPSERPSALAWLKEKKSLLKTHPGWFVAYQDGVRVALEPGLDRLVKAVDEALGEHRRPVQFREIIDKPVIHRGPSPRYMADDGPYSSNAALLDLMDYWCKYLDAVPPITQPQWAIDAGRD